MPSNEVQFVYALAQCIEYFTSVCGQGWHLENTLK